MTGILRLLENILIEPNMLSYFFEEYLTFVINLRSTSALNHLSDHSTLL